MEDFSKNSRKNSKLKEKTQNSRKKLNVSEDLSSPTLSSDVKKKPGLSKNDKMLDTAIFNDLL